MNAPENVTPADAWWWFGELATLKVRSEWTGGALSVLEILAPPDLSVPMHVHHGEDETFVILEGNAQFRVGDKSVEAGAGSVLFGPRGVPHCYTVGPNGCRMLFVFTPGQNMERFVRASAVRALAPTLPPDDVVTPPLELLLPLMKTHALAFV